MKQFSNPINKEEAITFLFIGLFSTLVPSIIFSSFDGILVAILLFFMFRLFFKKYDTILFTFSYGLFLLTSTIFLLIVNFVNGSPFLTGGDDLLFYNAGKELLLSNFDINIEVDGIPLWLSNYPSYLFLISFYYKFLSFIGLNTLHFYNFTLFKVTLGSLIPILIYKIGELISFRISKVTLLVIILFPTTIYHTTTFLRESIISFFFVISVFVILSKKPSIYKFLLLSLLSIIIYFIRPVHSLFLIFFYILYFVLKRKNTFWFKFIFVILFIISGLVILNFNDSSLFLQYQNTQNSYLELTQLTAQDGSLGLKLYGSNNPLLWPLKYLYYLMSPIPPPIVGSVNLLTFFVSLGSILWYFIVLGFLISGFRKVNRNNTYFLTLFILFLIAGAVGVNTSKDPRHLIFIYPLIIPYGLRELRIIPKFTIYLIIVAFVLLGLIGYILLKFVV